MKYTILKFTKITFAAFLLVFALTACYSGSEGKSSKSRKGDSLTLITSNINGLGRVLEIEVKKGKAFNHPTFVIWLEDSTGKYIQTLFVTQAIGKGIFTYGDKSAGVWKPGEVRRPAAVPYWAHKRGILTDDGSLVPTSKNQIPDAYSGATPTGSFRLTTRSDVPITGKYKIMLEINQTWDWNEYWTNNRYPDDMDYKSSCQPAVVYEADINTTTPTQQLKFKPVGHSHYAGKTGELFTDLNSITTALNIAQSITVTLK